MVENTNSIILEVQRSFGLTYIVVIIPPNLGWAWRGEASETLVLQLPVP
jgi:hypothetical protein